MSQGPLCPNLSQKVQKEVSQMANRNLSCVILLGGLSVNLNHLKTQTQTETQPEAIYYHPFSTYLHLLVCYPYEALNPLFYLHF